MLASSSREAAGFLEGGGLFAGAFGEGLAGGGDLVGEVG
jgi:hypothetical protein